MGAGDLLEFKKLCPEVGTVSRKKRLGNILNIENNDGIAISMPKCPI